MRQKNAISIYFEGHKVFWILVCAIVFLIGLYLYFVSASIVNVLIREEILIEIAATNSKVGELEAEYVTQKNNISLEHAKGMGFVEVANKRFVTRKTLAGSILTLRR